MGREAYWYAAIPYTDAGDKEHLMDGLRKAGIPDWLGLTRQQKFFGPLPEIEMTSFPVQGGCHCGAVRYTLLAPALSVQHCHCSQCRKGYGVLAAQGAVVERSSLKIEGERDLTTYRKSPGYSTQFCKTCGCPLFAYEDSEARLMYFRPATLDGGVHPGHPADKEVHIYVGSSAEWERISDDLPKYEANCPDEIVTQIQRKPKP